MTWAWVGAAAILAATLAGGVLIANATVFSASSFVRDYLGALSADRIEEVLALPGVSEIDADVDVDAALLVTHVGEPFAFEVIGASESSGVHLVSVAFGPDPDRLTSRTVLAVEQVGSRFLLFPKWGFAAPPTTELTVELSGDGRFTIGERAVESDDPTAIVTVLRPGLYRLAHESAFLESRPVTVAAERVRTSAALEILPNDEFVAAVNAALDAQLDTCAEQTVLFPVGCPFGFSITDRVVSEPEWQVEEPPRLSIVPGEALGLWRVARASGIAQLSVDVQDLYDGTISTQEHDVDFAVAFDVSFDGDSVVLLPR